MSTGPSPHLIFSLLLFALSSGLLIIATAMPFGMFVAPGAGFFPTIICVSLFLLSGLAVIRDYRSRGEVLVRASRKPVVLGFALGGIATALLIEPIGFPATSFLAIAVTLRAFLQVSLVRSLVVAAGLTGIATLVFMLIDIPLPMYPDLH